jgi:hypothetical protein
MKCSQDRKATQNKDQIVLHTFDSNKRPYKIEKKMKCSQDRPTNFPIITENLPKKITARETHIS